MLENIRDLYNKNEFWSHTAKSLYPTLPFLKKKIIWTEIMPKFFEEFKTFESRRGFIVGTKEPFQEFFKRLASALVFKGKLSKLDYEKFSDALFTQGFPIPDLQSEYGKDIIFRACLECGRPRRDIANKEFFFNFVKEPRTVYNFVEYPIDKPLPKIMEVSSEDSGVEILIEKLRKTVDYHLVACGADLEYMVALREIATRFMDLEEAYKTLKNRPNLTEEEKIFITVYPDIMESMS